MAGIVILGAGESGVGAAILAKAKGLEVFVSDMGEIKHHYAALLEQHHIDYESGQHTFDRLKDATEIIKSPGIPDDAPVISQIQDYRQTAYSRTLVPVISEIEFASRYTKAKMICITGSNGKTTTTSLIYDMLCRAGLDVGLAGNIGHSLALQVAEHDRQYYVIELSSFQLDNMYEFRANIAILLNITPDHLDRYQNEFQNYINAKMRITRNQQHDDALIFWSGDPVIDKQISKLRPAATIYPFAENTTSLISDTDGGQPVHNAAYIDGNNLIVNALPLTSTACQPLSIPVEELSLKGKHNQYNSMAAAITAQLLHIKNDVIRESLQQFEGVAHRLQYVATVRGVRYINDSKATNVNSCWYALESMTTPTVLILGGKDKGNDYSEIDRLVLEKCPVLVFMGLHNEKLIEHFSALGFKETALHATVSPAESTDRRFISTHTLADAIAACYENARSGETVLLSPCCASFDLFHSYEDRGEQFMQAVRNL